MPRNASPTSAMVKAFARAHGCSEGNAYHHKTKNSDKWKAFAATYLPAQQEQRIEGKASSESTQIIISPESAGLPAEALTPEQWAELQEWKSYSMAALWASYYISIADPDNAQAWMVASEKAHKSFHLAKKARIQAELEAGTLRSAQDWQHATASVLRVAAVFENIENEAALPANPLEPSLARAALIEWKKQKLDPAINQLLQAIG